MENDVAATARITASIRARETARPDALFRDPLAEVLAGHAAMAAMQAMPEAVRERSSMYTVIRTRVFDDWLLTTLGPGARGRAGRAVGRRLRQSCLQARLAARRSSMGAGSGVAPGRQGGNSDPGSCDTWVPALDASGRFR